MQIYIDCKHPATLKMVRFVLTINNFPPLTSFSKASNLDVAGILDLPMNALSAEICLMCL